MKRLILSFLAVFFVSCTKKETPKEASQDQFAKKNEIIRVNQTKEAKTKPSDFSKILREAIYFSNSLEREALKLILKDSGFQKNTLFSVLSYVVETNSGAKKSSPFGLDCGTYTVRPAERQTLIFKSCVKPESEVVRIHMIRPDEHYRVQFLIKEWAAVVGWAVALTGSDVVCDLRIKEKKLQRFSCQNWSYQISEDQISSTVVKAGEFVFERDAAKQFVIKGGFFKELVENRKIDIVVPLEGKIRIFEKELQVIDEFAEEAEDKKEEEVKENAEQKVEKESDGQAQGEGRERPEGPQNNIAGEAPAEGENRDSVPQPQFIEPPVQLPPGFGPREVSPEILYGPQEGYPEEIPAEEEQPAVTPAPTRSRGR